MAGYRFTTARDRTLRDALERLAQEVGAASVLDSPPPRIEASRERVSREEFVAQLLRAQADEMGPAPSA